MRNYNIYVKFFFEQFKSLKDFLYITKWKIIECHNQFVFSTCFSRLKIIWIKERENKLSEDLKVFISKLILMTSVLDDSFVNELSTLEKVINNPRLFLYIYSLALNNPIINKDSPLEKYMCNYIYLYTKEGEPLTIYYRLLTLYDEYKLSYLKKSLTTEYAIKVEDFINYPKVKEERLFLFVSLYRYRYFLEDFEEITNLDYYKESISSKDKIINLKYKDAIIMSKNITEFQNLFLYFLPYNEYEENRYKIDSLLIDFHEICNKCKEKYNSLKLVLNYWKHFFYLTKKAEIEKLVELLNKLDNTPIIDFYQYETDMNSFLHNMNEAEKNDKLFNSFFFMGLYKDYSVNFKEDEEKEKFQYTLSSFNELKLLGTNTNIELLSHDLVYKLTKLVYKNNDRLDDELLLIKEYFELDKNGNNFNFDVFKIKKSLMIQVNNYKV